VGTRLAAPVQTGPEAYPPCNTNGYRVIPSGYAARAWR